MPSVSTPSPFRRRDKSANASATGSSAILCPPIANAADIVGGLSASHVTISHHRVIVVLWLGEL